MSANKQQTTQARRPNRTPSSGGGFALAGGRRQELLAAAGELFREKGYEATSMQDVADAIGILKGSLYHYIGTKEDLLYEIVYENQSAVIELITEIAQSDMNPVEKIEEFVRRQVVYNTGHITWASVYQRDFQSLHGDRRQRVIAERDKYEYFLRDLIRDGQSQGLIETGVDAKLVGIAILSMMNFLYLWYRPQGSSTPDEIANQFIGLISQGITRPANEQQRSRRP